MKIHTAWCDDDGFFMISAYDEWTGDVHNGVPEFHTSEMNKVRAEGLEVRELVLEIPDTAVTNLFATPVVKATAIDP